MGKKLESFYKTLNSLKPIQNIKLCVARSEDQFQPFCVWGRLKTPIPTYDTLCSLYRLETQGGQYKSCTM